MIIRHSVPFIKIDGKISLFRFVEKQSFQINPVADRCGAAIQLSTSKKIEYISNSARISFVDLRIGTSGACDCAELLILHIKYFS